MATMERREAEVARTVEQLRRIEAAHGVTSEALEAMKPVLVELASRTDLFPDHEFPVGDGRTGSIYHLAEDRDGRFALYASAGRNGKFQSPHNHTTWAVISGVYGDEHNICYQRTDNGAEPQRGTLRKTGELTVRRGNAIAFLPDDFHTIEVLGDRPALHLHMYGRTLEDLPGRIGFEGPEGGTWKRFMAKPEVFSPLVSSATLKEMLVDGAELALLDVREEGVFSRGHLLFAGSLPLSQLELRIDALVPRLQTRIVLCDDDEALAQRAAARLRHFGYRNIAVLSGGVPAWRTAGYEVFSGVYVPSKAFGEYVEHHDDTPRWTAQELKSRLDAGEDLVILDSRPMSEFHSMSIPGGIDCPGAELVHRVFEAAPRPETIVVVNCAGRTRSIIGAQSLINAGIPNKVVALMNGTMGWHLAGLKVAHGETRTVPKPGPAALARAREAAERVADRFRVKRIDRQDLARFAAERDRRTLYLLDVRTPEEYEAGHHPESLSAPGGQLVQSTDFYAPVRNARLVLVDDDGVRAIMTASWLVQMGWDEVYALTDDFSGLKLSKGARQARIPGLDEAAVSSLDAAELDARLREGAVTVVDLDTSLAYRAGHIAGAWWGIRARLAAARSKLPTGPLVLTSSDGILARLAAADLADPAVCVLAGGTAAWTASGRPLEGGEQRLLEPLEDVYYRPYDNAGGIEKAMQAYLDWEIELVHQIERDGAVRFRRFPAG